jgi:hypothetical protein
MYTDSVETTSLVNDDTLKMYLRELDAVQPLTKDEESDLLRHLRSRDAQAESASRKVRNWARDCSQNRSAAVPKPLR